MIIQPIPDVFFISRKKKKIREKGLEEGEKKVLDSSELNLLLVILKKLLKIEIEKNVSEKIKKEEHEKKIEELN